MVGKLGWRGSRLIAAAVLVCGALIGLSFAGHAQDNVPDPYGQLEFRFIGPDGNRAIAVVGEPGNPLVTYVGAASGGIFKTADGGVTWDPIFDNQDVSSIGSLAIAPTAPNMVWAGTGETFLIRPAHAMGDGIYKSVDSGRNWARMGLEKTGRIGRVVIHPRNPDVVFACALGHAFGPQPDRGVYRTKDGGKTWEQVLKVDDNTGCSDLSMDVRQPDVLFAGMWPIEIKTWRLNSGGAGGGVYVSRDGGTSWRKLAGHGLPAADHPVGKVAVAVAPSNSERVYALIEDTTPGLYRSNDGGQSWKLVNQAHILAERSPYYTRFAVAPDNEDLLYFASVSWSVSRDGGDTLDPAATPAGFDHHDIWIDPLDPQRIAAAHDGGAGISLNRGRTYRQVVLPIAQMYHVAVDSEIPYHVYGNRQDGFSYRGPSNSLTGGFYGSSIPLGLWEGVGGCESGFGIPDPSDHDIIWSGCYDGQLDVTNMKTGESRSVDVWPDATYGWAPADVKERWHWSFPMVLSRHDAKRVYVGSQRVHMSADRGHSWTVISPDLTLNDKTHQQSSGGITTDNLMTWDGSLLYAIAESPVEKGLIWTGSNDGQVHLTRDGGAHWTNVTANIKGLPPWGTISNIEPSRHDAGTAYISVDFHQVGQFDPYAYKTSDHGKTWTLVTASVPKSVHSYVHIIREDPVRKGMLYLGTDNALYVSWDDGRQWTRLKSGLPPAPVHWLEIQPQFHDLVVATYGRGFYILDDLTPLRAMNDQVRTADVQLFTPRPAYRFRDVGGIHFEASFVSGKNPPYGASINYFLKAAADKPVEITIAGPGGESVRTMTGPAKAGINRVWWDLRYDPERTVKLRTSPLGAPWVKLGPEGWRSLVTWSGGHIQPVVAPGAYTVKLNAGGKNLSQPLTVLKDPHAEGSAADIKAQVDMLLEMRGDLNEVVDMINRLEWIRSQLDDLKRMLDGNPKAAPVLKAAGDFEQKAISAENNLVDVSLTGMIEDSFRSPMRLYGKMLAMAGNLGRHHDYPPTTQQIAVHKEFQQRLADYRGQFKTVIEKDTPAFNATLKSNGFAAAIQP